ncbi:MAG: hypothetical protein U5K30_00230 [Acidimicrobiales bacterium]|nr:hypothetical protein [Acidimicrobiales bacterium]
MSADLDLVWYVGYGSNVLRRRFTTYLTGGAMELSGQEERGSRDRSPPREVRPTTLPHTLYFGRSGGARWGPGGVAFIDPMRSDAAALGLAYLVSTEQYLDVICQENSWSVPPRPDDALPAPGSGAVDVTPPGERPGWYRSVVTLEPIDGVPALTFTHPVVEPSSEPAPAAYLRVIAEGLADEHGLATPEIVSYLASRPGVGRSREDLDQLLRT